MENCKHVMIDIETLGKNPRSPILSIAAVEFSFETGIKKDTPEFHEKIDIDFYDDYKDSFEMDYSTLKWWLKSPRALINVCQGQGKLDEVLTRLTEWFQQFGKNYDVRVWCQSPDFDCVILENAYKWANKEVPWTYWNKRCTRTYYEIVNFKSAKGDHDALNDCKLQVAQICKVYAQLTHQKKQ
jgi:exodeoxyribonuclease VIII